MATPKRKRLEEILGNQLPKRVGRPPKIYGKEPGQTNLTQFGRGTNFQDAVNTINATVVKGSPNAYPNRMDFNIYTDK